jgi:UDP-2,3-diacylglucosamine pyrophosphatase LpxH
MIRMPSFDQVYVISDLHMGGPPGHQIFGQTALLARFIDFLRTGTQGECCLVINGDMVDFLAQPGAVYFDPEGAIRQLDNIAQNFSEVWRSLSAYVRTANRHLTIVLGNHDLELALPWVREHLLQRLSDGDAGARRRIHLCFDGAGFACEVGNHNVLCLHGNEVDDWNVTDYETLRRIVADTVQGRVVRPWTPNAGSKLVVDVMNDIKEQHAFIDLLKPEKEAALRVALAMRPEMRFKATDVVGILQRRWVSTPVRSAAYRVLEEEEAPAAARRAEAERTVAHLMAAGAHHVDAERLMDEVEKDFRDGRDPVDLVYERGPGQLGIWSALAAAVSRKDSYRVAWELVKELAGDETMKIRKTDDDYDKIDALAGANFDVVIAGHTHLARILARRNSRGLYFNTGTWAWLMHLEPDQLKTAETFKPVFERLSAAKRIEDLGDLKFPLPAVAVVKKGSDPALKKVVPRKNTIGFADLEDNR